VPDPTASPPAPRRRTTRLQTTAAALGAGLVLALVSAPAYAHDELRSSSPGDGTTLAQPPAQIVLTFEEPPVALGAQVVVTGPDGPVSSGTPRPSP
jgi:methionine-rich copper-binding protein CopC